MHQRLQSAKSVKHDIPRVFSFILLVNWEDVRKSANWEIHECGNIVGHLPSEGDSAVPIHSCPPHLECETSHKNCERLLCPLVYNSAPRAREFAVAVRGGAVFVIWDGKSGNRKHNFYSLSKFLNGHYVFLFF